jgi:hypothetical protein
VFVPFVFDRYAARFGYTAIQSRWNEALKYHLPMKSIATLYDGRSEVHSAGVPAHVDQGNAAAPEARFDRPNPE